MSFSPKAIYIETVRRILGREIPPQGPYEIDGLVVGVGEDRNSWHLRIFKPCPKCGLQVPSGPIQTEAEFQEQARSFQPNALHHLRCRRSARPLRGRIGK